MNEFVQHFKDLPEEIRDQILHGSGLPMGMSLSDLNQLAMLSQLCNGHDIDGIRELEHRTNIFIGPNGEVNTHTFGHRIVPYTGELHEEVQKACEEARIFMRKANGNIEEVNKLKAEIMTLTAEVAEESQFLFSKLVHQFPIALKNVDDFNDLEMHKNDENKIALSVINDSVRDLGDVDLSELFAEYTAVKEKVAELSNRQGRFNELKTIIRPHDNTMEMLQQRVRRLMKKHHSDLNVATMGQSPDGLVIEVIEEVDEQQNGLSDKLKAKLNAIYTLTNEDIPEELQLLLNGDESAEIATGDITAEKHGVVTST